MPIRSWPRPYSQRLSTAALSCTASRSQQPASSPTPAAIRPRSSSPCPFATGRTGRYRARYYCDSKSGVSGAGKAATAKTHFMYAADNLSAYNVFGHRHTGELLDNSASMRVRSSSRRTCCRSHAEFFPRSTFVSRTRRLPAQSLLSSRSSNKDSPLVRLHATPALPQIQHVVRTNFCDIGFELAKDAGGW